MSMKIPESALPVCVGCEQRIVQADLSSRFLAREVIGFSLARSQGGQNHVLGRSETGRLLCPDCTRRLKDGQPGGQGTFL